MDTYDIKKAFSTLYAPKPGDFHVVEVPELSFLMTDGHGDPNVSPAYAEAVEALFSLSYAVRATAQSELGRVHTVGPLEGLWSADDPRAYTSEIIETATKKAQKKALAALDRVRYAPYTEGASVQILHIGSYDSEAPVLARLHDEYLPKHSPHLQRQAPRDLPLRPTPHRAGEAADDSPPTRRPCLVGRNRGTRRGRSAE